MSILIKSQDSEVDSYQLRLGMADGASDGLDLELETLAPPEPKLDLIKLNVYWQIDHQLFPHLFTEFRPELSKTTFRLVV